MTNPIALDLLKLAEHYLSALHGSVARHDNIGLNLSCGGCALRDEIRDVLPKLAAAVSVPPPAPQAAALSEAERTMLAYALDQAQEHIWSRDGFTDEDQAAVTSLRRLAADAPTTTKPEHGTRTADLLAGSATEYRVPVPEGGGTNLIVRRQGVAFGAGWSVAVPGWGGGRAWTAEGWQESISALSVDRLFCWPDAETAVTEARRALAAGVGQDGAQP